VVIFPGWAGGGGGLQPQADTSRSQRGQRAAGISAAVTGMKDQLTSREMGGNRPESEQEKHLQEALHHVEPMSKLLAKKSL